MQYWSSKKGKEPYFYPFWAWNITFYTFPHNTKSLKRQTPEATNVGRDKPRKQQTSEVTNVGIDKHRKRQTSETLETLENAIRC